MPEKPSTPLDPLVSPSKSTILSSLGVNFFKREIRANMPLFENLLKNKVQRERRTKPRPFPIERTIKETREQ